MRTFQSVIIVAVDNKLPTSQLRKHAYNAESTLQLRGVCIVETVSCLNAQDVKLLQQKKIASTAENVNWQTRKSNR